MHVCILNAAKIEPYNIPSPVAMSPKEAQNIPDSFHEHVMDDVSLIYWRQNWKACRLALLTLTMKGKAIGGNDICGL